jgi:hypothetical protein
MPDSACRLLGTAVLMPNPHMLLLTLSPQHLSVNNGDCNVLGSYSLQIKTVFQVLSFVPMVPRLQAAQRLKGKAPQSKLRPHPELLIHHPGDKCQKFFLQNADGVSWGRTLGIRVTEK